MKALNTAADYKGFLPFFLLETAIGTSFHN
jgi:hypothetical protein